jgi:hypothetical protein
MLMEQKGLDKLTYDQVHSLHDRYGSYDHGGYLGAASASQPFFF